MEIFEKIKSVCCVQSTGFVRVPLSAARGGNQRLLRRGRAAAAGRVPLAGREAAWPTGSPAGRSRPVRRRAHSAHRYCSHLRQSYRTFCACIISSFGEAQSLALFALEESGTSALRGAAASRRQRIGGSCPFLNVYFTELCKLNWAEAGGIFFQLLGQIFKWIALSEFRQEIDCTHQRCYLIYLLGHFVLYIEQFFSIFF